MSKVLKETGENKSENVLLRRPKIKSSFKSQYTLEKTEDVVSNGNGDNPSPPRTPPAIVNVSRRSNTRSSKEKQQSGFDFEDSLIVPFDGHELGAQDSTDQKFSRDVEHLSVSKSWAELEKALIKARKSFIDANREEARVIQEFHRFIEHHGNKAREVIDEKWYDRIRRREEARAAMDFPISLSRSNSIDC